MHVPKQPARNDPARREVLKGSLIAFNHAGREVLGEYFDQARVKKMLKQIQLVFVSSRGKVDQLEYKALKNIEGLRLNPRIMYNYLKVQLALYPEDHGTIKELPTLEEFCQLFADAEATIAKNAQWTESDGVERVVKEKASDVAHVRDDESDAASDGEADPLDAGPCSDDEDSQELMCGMCGDNQMGIECSAMYSGHGWACRCTNAGPRVRTIPDWLHCQATVDYCDCGTWRSATVCGVHCDDPSDIYITLCVGGAERQTTLDHVREALKSIEFNVDDARSLIDLVWRAYDVKHPESTLLPSERALQSKHVQQYLVGGEYEVGDPDESELLRAVACFWENVVVDFRLGGVDSVWSATGTCFSNSDMANFHHKRAEALVRFRNLRAQLMADEGPIFRIEAAGVHTQAEAGGAANIFDGVINLLQAHDTFNGADHDDAADNDNDNGDDSDQAAAPDSFQVPRHDVPFNEFDENAKLLYSSFWDHFPLRAGLARDGPLRDAESRHLLTQFDNEFAHDLNFLFMLADQKQRHSACRGVARRIKANKAAFQAFGEMVAAAKECIAKLVAARDHVLATGKIDEKGRELLKEISRFVTLAGASVPWSEEERSAEITKFYADARRFGGGSCFLTVALDDVHQPTMIRLCYRGGKPTDFPAVDGGLLQAVRSETDENTDKHQAFVDATRDASTTVAGQPVEEYEFKLGKDRERYLQRLASLNPVATTLFYEQICEAIFTHLVGLPPTGKRNVVTKPAAERQKGLFGVPFCASAVTELNARKSMHLHGCIHGGTPPALLSHVAGHEKLERLVCEALDSMFSAHVPIEIHAVDAARKALKVNKVHHALLPMRDYEKNPQAFKHAASFAATATGTHKCTFTCEKGKQGKCSCRMCMARGHGEDLHERTRVVKVVSTEGGKPLGEKDKELLNAKGEPLHRCEYCDKHPWLESVKCDDEVRKTTHLKAVKARPGGDLERDCLMYELKRPLLSADSTHSEALRTILAWSEEQVNELCDNEDIEVQSSVGTVRLVRLVKLVQLLVVDLGYLLDMPEAGRGLKQRLKDVKHDEAIRFIKQLRKGIHCRNASLVEFSQVLAGCVRCNAPPLLLGAGAGNRAANMYMRKVAPWAQPQDCLASADRDGSLTCLSVVRDKERL